MWGNTHSVIRVSGRTIKSTIGEPRYTNYPTITMTMRRQRIANWQIFSRYTPNGRSPNLPSSTSKKVRRRVATVSQRRAANIRERRRMFNLNEAFDKLRRKVRKSRISARNCIFLAKINRSIERNWHYQSGTFHFSHETQLALRSESPIALIASDSSLTR